MSEPSIDKSARPQGSGPVYQLESEWPVLARGALAAALPDWQQRQPPLRRFDTPKRLLTFLNSTCAAETDAPLLGLLALARDERLAGRLLLQAILPALKRQAERIACEPGRRDEVWELLLFFAWEAICCYPLERRRSRVAANLVLQVLHDTTRELGRPQLGPVPGSPRSRTLTCMLLGAPELEALQQEAVQPPAAERLGADGLLIRAVAAGVIAAHEAELILQTRVDGVSLRLLASVHGVGYHGLRQRRQRAERRLRQLLRARPDVSKAPVSDLISHGGSPSRPRRARAAPDRPNSGSREAA